MSDITITGVTKRYSARPPVAALDGIDLTIDGGSITAVLGPSGCGKTTLLRVIAGFERPDAGTVQINGDVVASPTRWVRPEHRRIGIVPQEGALFPHLDIAGNVGFALSHRRSAAARARVAELLELVGLAGYDRRRPHELSGGQQQRVALARALAARPAVVLLDEPFTALDHSLRARLRADITAVIRHEATTAVIVTHDPGEAMSMADTIAVMRAGRIVQRAPSRELYASPTDAATAGMLGDIVVLRGRLAGESVVTVLGPVAVRPGDGGPLGTASAAAGSDVDVVVRPEQIRRTGSGVTADVVDVEFHGYDGLVTLDAAGTLVRARWASDELPLPGETATIGVAGPAVVVVPADAD